MHAALAYSHSQTTSLTLVFDVRLMRAFAECSLFRFLVYFFFRLRAPLAWTLTVQLHAVCTFMSFHWNKGLPYADLIQSDVAGLTAWEQLSRAPSTFKARSFLTIAPVLL